MPNYDTDYDASAGTMIYRDEHGRMSYRHPAQHNPSPVRMYDRDGYPTDLLSPPSSSRIVIVPEIQGNLCYMHTDTGVCSWYPPNGSGPLSTRGLTSIQLPTDPLPPPPDFRTNALHGSGWTSFFRDSDNKVLLMHIKTGAVRLAPWIALRSPMGKIMFYNLVTQHMRKTPPDHWYSDFLERRAACSSTVHTHPCYHLREDQTLNPHSALTGQYARQCVER